MHTHASLTPGPRRRDYSGAGSVSAASSGAAAQRQHLRAAPPKDPLTSPRDFCTSHPGLSPSLSLCPSPRPLSGVSGRAPPVGGLVRTDAFSTFRRAALVVWLPGCRASSSPEGSLISWRRVFLRDAALGLNNDALPARGDLAS